MSCAARVAAPPTRPVYPMPRPDAIRRGLLELLAATAGAGMLPASAVAPALPARIVPVLAWHRFAATRADSMTLRTATLDAHLRLLSDLGVRVVGLRDLVASRRPGGPALPPRAVAISADDGHRSQYELLAPRLARAGLGAPVTLFIYPSALSNASYAMTWAQLVELLDSGAFELQSHTWWHPDLVRDRRTMAPEAFERHARAQLVHARELLRARTGREVTLLAWPFGRSDAGLRALAAATGHEAAFGLGARPVRPADDDFDLPRLLVTDDLSARELARWLEAAFAEDARREPARRGA